jgi:hypothetical protein
MSLKQSKQVAAGAPVPSTCEANELYAITGDYTIKAGDAQGDIIEFGGIPANSTVVDMVIHHDGVGGTVDVGILSGDYAKKDNARTCGQEFGAALASANAGVLRLAKNTNAVPMSEGERGWGVKLLAAPVVGKVISATLFVVPKGF